MDAELVESRGDVVAGAGNVGDAEVGRCGYVDGDDAESRRGVVVGRRQAGIAEGAVAFGVVVSLLGNYSSNGGGFSVDFIGVNGDADLLRLPNYFLVFLWERRFEQLRSCFRVPRQNNLYPSELLDCVLCADGRNRLDGLF